MWFWEVLWQDPKGNVHSYFSLQGYPDSNSALQVFNANKSRVEKDVHKNSGKIVDVQIVFKSDSKLY